MSSPASARPKPLWQPLCLVVGLFLLLISGSLLSQGMSEAGLKNSVIAQNVAEGYGAFWNPCPSEFDPAPEANNYLPLGYWLQSIVMRLWGKAPWLDKLYSMLIFLVEAFLMGALWHRAGNPRRTLWIPLLFWLVVPVVSWSATNNLLEGTQSVFVMLSVWCYLCGVHPAPSKVAAPQRYSLRRLLWVVGATACIGIAFLVKGFSALFPLAMPPLLWVVSNDKRRNWLPWIDWAVMAAVAGVSYLLFLLTGGETGRQVMYHYVHHQLIGGLLHVHTVASHFYILYALVLQLLPSLVLVGVVALWLMRGGRARRRLLFWRPTSGASAADERGMRYVYLFLLLGLTGVLPIMVGRRAAKAHRFGRPACADGLRRVGGRVGTAVEPQQRASLLAGCRPRFGHEPHPSPSATGRNRLGLPRNEGRPLGAILLLSIQKHPLRHVAHASAPLDPLCGRRRKVERLPSSSNQHFEIQPL